ncbi:MAG TPA: hypothetical protein VMF03_01430 [Steroidobacteraceae bacterium]|nr:hypothetical protein [Steroidobacteraceae bacterium]
MKNGFITATLAALLLGGVPALQAADNAPFDLTGPELQVDVTRGSRTLPVADVPNLMAGDHVAIKADLPTTQAAHYVLVVAFLRGATNPPPEDWFYRCETWSRKCAKGIDVTVPEEAQQVLVFLAPSTSGDFSTLRDAVRGRPGAFVRASQDLNQASLDRSRLESYLQAVRALDEADPSKLRAAAPLLARSLAIKVDDKCLQKIPELQAPCLLENQDSLVLNDGHSTSIVEALTNGPASDLAMEASYTPQLRYGYYSPYIASIIDIGRILGSFHTAQYQYLPALPTAHEDHMELTLNAPPSFHNPKSVLVTALPAIEQPQLPPLHAVDPQEIYCARKSGLVLPVEGAPLVFSTHYVHDVALRLTGADGRTLELPAAADARQGGFVVDTSALNTANLGDSVVGTLHGFWGFDLYQAPTFHLVNTRQEHWALPPGDQSALVIGREGTVHLTAESVGCVDHIMLKDGSGKELKVDWKPVKPDAVELKLPLEDAAPGTVTLLVSQFGAKDSQEVALNTFTEAAHLGGFEIHAGDEVGTLTGTRLDEVAMLTLNGIQFAPGSLTGPATAEELPMMARDVQAVSALKGGDAAAVKVTLKDGRTFSLAGRIDAPRPSVVLVAKNIQASQSGEASHIALSDSDQLPQDSVLMFSIRTMMPEVFSRTEQIEVATADNAFTTQLSIGAGTLTLADAHVAVATLDPAKAFGPSAFGPLRFRVVADGVPGAWAPLATLVRLPRLAALECPSTAEVACKLSGTGLYLLDSISADPQFHNAVQVPDGFPGTTLPVPHPNSGELYVRLRDDPVVVNAATLGTQVLPPPPAATPAAESSRAAAADSAPVVVATGSESH